MRDSMTRILVDPPKAAASGSALAYRNATLFARRCKKAFQGDPADSAGMCWRDDHD